MLGSSCNSSLFLYYQDLHRRHKIYCIQNSHKIQSTFHPSSAPYSRISMRRPCLPNRTQIYIFSLGVGNAALRLLSPIITHTSVHVRLSVLVLLVPNLGLVRKKEHFPSERIPKTIRLFANEASRRQVLPRVPARKVIALTSSSGLILLFIYLY